MPWTNSPTIDDLRRRYNVAIAVHQESARALRAAQALGETPSRALQNAEAKAADELKLARDQLLAAVTAAIAGQVEKELRIADPTLEDR